MYKVGDKVIISENIFPGSTNPVDVAARGARGVIVEDYSETLGEEWRGCYAVQTEAGIIYVTEKEIGRYE